MAADDKDTHFIAKGPRRGLRQEHLDGDFFRPAAQTRADASAAGWIVSEAGTIDEIAVIAVTAVIGAVSRWQPLKL